MLGLRPVLVISLLSLIIDDTLSDVVVETKKNFRPFRIYEDLPARWENPLIFNKY